MFVAWSPTLSRFLATKRRCADCPMFCGFSIMCVSNVRKVTCHRRAQCDQLDGAALGLDLERIELLVFLDDPGRAFEVALNEAAHRFFDRMLGKSAHLTDERTQTFNVLIKRLERMSAG